MISNRKIQYGIRFGPRSPNCELFSGEVDRLSDGLQKLRNFIEAEEQWWNVGVMVPLVKVWIALLSRTYPVYIPIRHQHQPRSLWVFSSFPGCNKHPAGLRRTTQRTGGVIIPNPKWTTTIHCRRERRPSLWSNPFILMRLSKVWSLRPRHDAGHSTGHSTARVLFCQRCWVSADNCEFFFVAKTCNYYRAWKQATKTENKGLFLVFFEIMTGLCCNSSSRRLMGVHIPGRYHGQSWRGFGPTDSWVRLLHCFVKWFMTFLGLKHVQLKPIIGCSHPLLRLMIIYNLCIYIYIYMSWLFKRWFLDISFKKTHFPHEFVAPIRSISQMFFSPGEVAEGPRIAHDPWAIHQLRVGVKPLGSLGNKHTKSYGQNMENN